MNFTIPELFLVVLIGVSGSGKSTFPRKHFKPTEILSPDYCRGLVICPDPQLIKQRLNRGHHESCSMCA